MSTLNLFGESNPKPKEKQVIPPPAKKAIAAPKKQIVAIPEKKEVVITKQPDNRTPEEKQADWRKENFPNEKPKSLKQLLAEKANRR
jgi:hypothetical protein